MTAQEFAERLTGREYTAEITRQEESMAKAAGLVVVFGYSDDGVEVCGAIDDEVGANNGTTLRFSKSGLLPSFDSVDHDDEEEMQHYFDLKGRPQWPVVAKWDDNDIGASWTFVTEIPHATFDIMEDGGIFCRGIVFDLARL